MNEAALFESDMYEYYVSNKINLSQSTYNDIALLPGISLITAKKISSSLHKHGRIIFHRAEARAC